MVRPAFGSHAVDFQREKSDDMCRAIDCEAPSTMVSTTIPLCEQHVMQVMREIREYTRTRMSPPPAPPSPGPKVRAPGVLGIPIISEDPHKSYVYYIAFGDRIKIGVTTNLINRLDGIPWDEVLTVEPGYRELEQKRHRQFRGSRVHGEWFTRSPDLLEHIQSVIAQEGQLGEGMQRYLRRQRLLGSPHAPKSS